MPAPPNYVFTVFAFVSFFLCLIKFPIRFHAWNVGIHLYLAWVGLNCLFLGINSIIWNHNTINWAPVWCDITTRFNFGISIAIPAILLCINRRLYLLASPTTIIPSQADKNREVIIDLVIGIGLPIMVMALEFLVQDARFVILEDYGCSYSILLTWVTLIIGSIPPCLLEIISGVYGCLSIRAFYNRSKESRINNPNNDDLDSNQYKRLMFFSTCDLLFALPITLFYLYLDITRLVPFPGLKQEYSNFSFIAQVPAVIWRASTLNELNNELNRWIMVWGAFLFFAIFGFTEESRNNYQAMLQPVVQVFIKITGIKSRPASGRNAELEGIVFHNSRSSRQLSLSYNHHRNNVPV